MKTCSRCSGEKSLEGFHKDKSKKDGYKTICKDCLKITRKRRYDAQREEAVEYSRKWRERNPEYRSEYWGSNKDRERETQRQWRGENPDYTRQWRKANPEKVKTYESRRREARRNGLSVSDIQESVAKRKAIRNDPCFYCSTTVGEFQDDHYYPVSKGGTDRPCNLVRSCSTCNRQKSDRCGTWFLLKVGS